MLTTDVISSFFVLFDVIRTKIDLPGKTSCLYIIYTGIYILDFFFGAKATKKCSEDVVIRILFKWDFSFYLLIHFT